MDQQKEIKSDYVDLKTMRLSANTIFLVRKDDAFKGSYDVLDFIDRRF